ncbi:MAG: hypothetical protein ACRC3A_08775 [Culicoidibacterales bacterium]
MNLPQSIEAIIYKPELAKEVEALTQYELEFLQADIQKFASKKCNDKQQVLAYLQTLLKQEDIQTAKENKNRKFYIVEDFAQLTTEEIIDTIMNKMTFTQIQQLASEEFGEDISQISQTIENIIRKIDAIR